MPKKKNRKVRKSKSFLSRFKLLFAIALLVAVGFFIKLGLDHASVLGATDSTQGYQEDTSADSEYAAFDESASSDDLTETPQGSSPRVLREVRTGTGTEPSVAVNPFNSNLVAVTYQYNYSSGCDFSGVRISRNGGQTWATTSRNPWSGKCADHHGQVAWGPGPTAGSSRLYVVDPIASNGIYIGVTYSDNLGASWATVYLERRTPPWVGGFPDITVDNNPDSPNYGVVYVTYNWKQSSNGVGVSVLASGDKGRTWQIVQVPPVGLSGYPDYLRVGYRLKAAPDGSAYVSFYEADLKYWNQNDIFNHGSSSNVGRVGFGIAKLNYNKTNHTLTADRAKWAKSLSESKLYLPYGPLWQSGLDIDSSGRIWMVVSDFTTKGYFHIGHSDNGGSTWTWKKMGISGYSAFKASIAVRNGVVFVGVHSMNSSGRVGTYYTVSYNNGGTFWAPRLVTTGTWSYNSITDGNKVGLRENAFFGKDGVVRYAYGDGRLGNSSVSVYVASIEP